MKRRSIFILVPVFDCGSVSVGASRLIAVNSIFPLSIGGVNNYYLREDSTGEGLWKKLCEL